MFSYNRYLVQRYVANGGSNVMTPYIQRKEEFIRLFGRKLLRKKLDEVVHVLEIVYTFAPNNTKNAENHFNFNAI
jgi:hypothetical protein